MAVQVLVVLAETDGPCSSSTLAQDLQAHAVFLRRVLAHLVRANLKPGHAKDVTVAIVSPDQPGKLHSLRSIRP